MVNFFEDKTWYLSGFWPLGLESSARGGQPAPATIYKMLFAK
jgi:hypothetical protein